ncbi:MAG: hypothetical protein INR71_00810 [Terriglobus roseus]|nr:hypothetical protein [Terriglobus roseus]
MPGVRGAVPVPLHSQGRDLTQEVLDALAEKDEFTTDVQFPDVTQIEIKAALDRLRSRFMVDYDTRDQETVVLTPEGEMIANEGSHEYKVWEAVKSKGKIAIKELPVGTHKQIFSS